MFKTQTEEINGFEGQTIIEYPYQKHAMSWDKRWSNYQQSTGKYDTDFRSWSEDQQLHKHWQKFVQYGSSGTAIGENQDDQQHLLGGNHHRHMVSSTRI